MSVKNCEKVETNRVALTVEVDAETFETAVEKAYRKIRGQITIPGFRRGKAPRKMIENLYGPEVFYDEAVNIAMPEAYMAAVESEKLEVVGYPDVELESVGKDGFSFKATVYVYPEVTLGQYKGIEAPKAEVKVTAADVNHRLEEMAQRNSRLVTVERPVEKGDIANIDFDGYDDGKPFEGGKGEGYELEIGSGTFVPGFEDQLIGMSAGEEKDIDITFPEDYHKDLAGKAVVFHVKVNSVQVKEVPAIDDEFAKDVSEFESLADLKKDIKAKITADRQQAADRAFEDVVMQKVADNLECDVPAPMVEDQARRFVEDLKMRIQQQGIPVDQYLKLTNMTEDDLLGQAKEPALRQVKLELALEAIAKAENVEVSEEEIEAEYASTAEKYGMKVEDLKKYIAVDGVRAQLTNQKVVKLVVDSAVPTKPEEKSEEGEEKPKKKTSSRKKSTKKADEAAAEGEAAESAAEEAPAEGGEA